MIDVCFIGSLGIKVMVEFERRVYDASIFGIIIGQFSY